MKVPYSRKPLRPPETEAASDTELTEEKGEVPAVTVIRKKCFSVNIVVLE